jgi:hypothetical protein
VQHVLARQDRADRQARARALLVVAVFVGDLDLSVIGAFESSTTIAVISFEIDAIGTTACEFLSNSGSPVFWSTTYATLERSASASGVSCRPNAWPTVGRRGWNATLRTAP